MTFDGAGGMDLGLLGDELFRGLMDEPLAWIVRPSYSDATFVQPSDANRGWMRRAHRRHIGGWSTQHLEVVERERVLFLSYTENQRRALAPLVADDRSRQVTARRPRAISAAWDRSVREFAAELHRRCVSMGIPEHASEAHIGRAARLMALAGHLVSVVEPRCLVVANQHSIVGRAFLLVARREGVPTAYVNHAPMAQNVQYMDLPVSYAGLRSQREVDTYARVGVEPDRIRVIGNPASELVAGAGRDPSGPVVLALSNPQDTAALAELVHAAHLDHAVVVAPHPAARADAERLALASGWLLNPMGSTNELLRSGVAAVIQRSSGIVWEAMRLGLPVVQVVLDDEPANFAMTAEPYVRFVTTPEELRAAVDDVRATDLERTVEWAISWCAMTGPAAVDAARQLVVEAAEGGVADWIFDRWGAADRA